MDFLHCILLEDREGAEKAIKYVCRSNLCPTDFADVQIIS